VNQATDPPAEDSLTAPAAPRPRRSPIIDVAVIGLGGYLLFWMFGDVRYFMQGSEPRDLGDAAALVEKGLAGENLAEQYVVLRGTPDVQHAARMKIKDRTIGFLRLVEGGGGLFAAVPRDGEAAPNQFEGRFEGRMRRLADSSNFPAIQQHFDAERIVEERDSTAAALLKALGERKGAGLTIADDAGRSFALGPKETVTLVVEQPDSQAQLGRSSFDTEAAAEAAVAALGVPYSAPAEQKNALFYTFYVRVAPDQRAATQAKLAAVATIPPDAKPADPRVGAVVIPWMTSHLVPAGQLAEAGGKFSFVPTDGRTGFVVQDGKLAARPLQDGKLVVDPSEVRAVRLERPVYVDPAGYLIEVGVRPHDRWLELAMWLLVLVVVGWNVASLAVWWRARRA
jgi:hypothetical protein